MGASGPPPACAELLSPIVEDPSNLFVLFCSSPQVVLAAASLRLLATASLLLLEDELISPILSILVDCLDLRFSFDSFSPPLGG